MVYKQDLSVSKTRPRSWRRPPRLPLHHATALQYWRQEACEDSDVMLRGHKWPRRSARPMLSLLGFRMGGVIEGYMLWAVATSAGSPIFVWVLPPIDSTVMWSTPQWPTRWSMPKTLFFYRCTKDANVGPTEVSKKGRFRDTPRSLSGQRRVRHL